MEPSVSSSLSTHIPLALGILVLLMFSAVFSGSETAFFSLPRSYVAGLYRGSRRERLVSTLLSRPRVLLVTILFGNLLVNISATSVVTALAISLFGDKGVGLAMVVMTVLILIFGEITPKSIALKESRRVAATVSPLLRVMMILFYPVRVLLGRIADYSVEVCRRLFGESEERFGARELATAVEIGHSGGLFDEFEKEVLTNLFLFAETTVHEILRPRVEVFSLDVETPISEAVIGVRSRGFTRVPLYEGKPENIVGVLHAKDLLRWTGEERKTLRVLLRPVGFVPETKKIRDLLGELISSRRHLLIVVDEHGSYEGIVTLEDILEEIFGDIRDRREPRVEEYNLLGDDSIVVEGGMRLEDLNEVFGTTLDMKEIETVGGFVTEITGRIPREGETFLIDGLRFLVISAGRTRVEKIKIERLGGEEG